MKQLNPTLVVLATLLTAVVGCNQRCCLQDYDGIYQRAGVPTDLASNPNIQNQPTMPDVPTPADVNQPERPPQYMTLHEAVAMALEHGTTGFQNTGALGQKDDSLLTAASLGGYTFFGDSIRVLALVPSIRFTDVESNLSRYDVQWNTVAGVTARDFPTDSSNGFTNGTFDALGTSLSKPLPTGGLAEITLGSETNQGLTPTTFFYNKFSESNFATGTLPQQYSPQVRLDFTQPLLKYFGADVENLLPVHPLANSSALTSQSPENTQSGILITRLAFDNTRADFERSVNYMLANVEIAYWNLYGAYVQLYAAEQALRQAHVTWKINKLRYDGGTIPITQYAQTRGQYENFRGNRIAAVNGVLNAERNLRALLGMPMEDGKRVVPVDSPTIAPYVPNWASALRECMTLRPELIMQRTDLRQKQMEILREANSLLPDLRFVADYIVQGAGTRLDGTGTIPGTNALPSNAFQSMGLDHYDSYSVGLTLSVPLGYRAQYAALRAAKLRLTQSYLQLQDQEYRAQRYLVDQYSNVVSTYEVIKARRAQREAYADQVEARFKEFVAGKTTADFLLQAQQDWANALQMEYQSIVDYNNALVKYEFAKGTLMAHDGVVIGEGNLPQCTQVRAVENERQRASAIVLREHDNAVPQVPVVGSGGTFTIPVLPQATAPSLPSLLMDQKDRAPKSYDDPIMPSGAPLVAPMPGVGGLSSSQAVPAATGPTAPYGYSLPSLYTSPAPSTSIPTTRAYGSTLPASDLNAAMNQPMPTAAVQSPVAPSSAPVQRPAPLPVATTPASDGLNSIVHPDINNGSPPVSQ
jgi:outer membrane protein TolC